MRALIVFALLVCVWAVKQGRDPASIVHRRMSETQKLEFPSSSLFSLHDANQDGFIDEKEAEQLYTAMTQRLDANQEEQNASELVKTFWEHVDIDQDGLISEAEYTASYSSSLLPIDPQQKAFKHLHDEN
eukprot:m.52336 g.52336  ORF g.52336 m.52336 type:complete len:130 (-) comp12692_c2_seq2:162-551(-)